MNRQSHFLFRSLASLLAVCLLLGVSGVSVFASSQSKISYASVQDEDTEDPVEDDDEDEWVPPVGQTRLPALAKAMDSGLYFKDGDEGKRNFKILQVSDLQDSGFPHTAMLKFLQGVLEQEKPDLIVLTGDNTNDFTYLSGQGSRATAWFLDLFEGIPFTLVFGNHDAQLWPDVKNQYLKKYYQKYPNCLAYDDKPSMTGVASHNLFLFADKEAADDAKTKTGTLRDAVFNLWMLDSNAYDVLVGDYIGVKQDQMNWYRIKEDKIATEAQYKVPSFLFQHIPMPEMAELLQPAAPGTTLKTKKYSNGVEYQMTLQGNAPDYADKNDNSLLEFPCPSSYKTNAEMMQAMSDYGNVLAVVTGHDHLNRFVRTYSKTMPSGRGTRRFSVDFIQTPGMTFASYGDDAVRGCRVIELTLHDKGDIEVTPPVPPEVSYTTRNISYYDYFDFSDPAQLAFYQAGSNRFFGRLASFCGWVSSLFGKDKYEAAYASTQSFGERFGGMLKKPDLTRSDQEKPEEHSDDLDSDGLIIYD